MGTADVTVTADRATFNPGDLVTFTLTIKWSSIRVGGAFITTGGVGTLQALAGEGLGVNAQGLTHTAPKAAVAGAVTFRFGWQAPAKPGAVDVYVAALAGNGNNASTGDLPAAGEFQWVFGCTERRSIWTWIATVTAPRTSVLGWAASAIRRRPALPRWTAIATRTTRWCTRAQPRSAT